MPINLFKQKFIITMDKTEIKNRIIETYEKNGLAAVTAYLKRNKIEHDIDYIIFDYDTNEEAERKQNEWINHQELRFYRASYNIHYGGNKWKHVRRGIRIIL